jgi:hypothetical protein
MPESFSNGRSGFGYAAFSVFHDCVSVFYTDFYGSGANTGSNYKNGT